MNISIGCDHAGFTYKEAIKSLLAEDHHQITDHGAPSEESVDYPDFAHPVANDVQEGKAKFGILICGSGNGVAMTANKNAGVRAALCWTSEISELARAHNDANVICIPARFTSKHQAVAIVKTFLSTRFEAGRHERRVKKIPLSC